MIIYIYDGDNIWNMELHIINPSLQFRPGHRTWHTVPRCRGSDFELCVPPSTFRDAIMRLNSDQLASVLGPGCHGNDHIYIFI